MVTGIIKHKWHTHEESGLTHKIPFEQSDFNKAKEALFCHKSQFTQPNMRDIVSFIGPAPGHVFLRRSHIKITPKSGLFE